MTAQESEFIASLVPGAQAAAQRFGVPASVTIAQAVLESGWGQHIPANSFNYFGIKALPGQPSVSSPTHEYVNGADIEESQPFAAYPSAAAGMLAHAQLLSQASRYAPAMAEKSNPAEFCSQLEACGYSTSPIYSEQLLGLINEFDLTQYDVEVAQ